MSERFSDKVEVVDRHSTVTILLDGQHGDIQLGNLGVRQVPGYPDAPNPVPGNLLLKNGKGLVTIHLDGATGDIQLGRNGTDGSVIITDKTGKERVRLEGLSAAVRVGGGGLHGRVSLLSGDGDQIVKLSAAPPHDPRFPTVAAPNVILGGNSHGCVASIRASDSKETIRLDGERADLILGGNGQDAVVIVKNGAGKETMRLDGQSGNATLGGNGADGDVIVRNQTGRGTIHLDGQSGDVILGGNGADGGVIVRDQAGKETVRIDGQTGDIVLLNADCAEDFDASELDGIEAGTVVVLDRQGRLCQSTEAYDRRVAGVVSGAGGNKPGIILDKRPAQTNRLPLALVGKVYCKADALFGPIDVGDLLTTSPTPGHAMKADDPAKAFGAVLGKALRPLRSGQGLIPILVALQ